VDSGTEAVRNGVGSHRVGSLGPLLGENGMLRHLDFVVASISKCADEFARRLDCVGVGI